MNHLSHVGNPLTGPNSSGAVGIKNMDTALKQTSRQDRRHEVQRLMEYALWRMAGIAASLVLFALMR